MIGTTIDQYRIVSRIGGGGMGEVYRAIDLELQRDVAIKCVRPELSDLDEVTKRFRNEARTLAKLSHPNIATVYRFFADNERLYLVMEYIQGTPFGGKLREGGGLPWQEAVSMIRNALHGLGYAHEHGIVHRDIKPGNLMVDQRGTVKVLDFGIAHLIGGTRLTRAGSVVGTPAYMAPEQILGKSVDPRTDLYSLGIVLYELLSGQLPYQGDSEFELMRSHLEKHPPPLRELTNSKIPIALQNTVETALGKEKEDRFQSAAEFEAALDEAIDDRTRVVVPKTMVLPPQAETQPAKAEQSGKADGPAPASMTELIKPVTTELRRRLGPSHIGMVAGGILVVLIAAGWLLRSDDPESPVAVPDPSVQPGSSPAPFVLQGGQLQNGQLSGAPASTPQFAGQGALPDGTVLQGNPRSPDVQGGAVDPVGTAGPGYGVSGTGGSGMGATGMGASGMGGVAPAQNLVDTPPATTQAPPQPRTQPRVQPQVQPQQQRPVQPVQSSPEPRPAAASGGVSITPIKVGYHERQGTGRWSRDAGYNGAFTLRFPPGRGQGLSVEEVVVVRQEGRVIKRIPVITETRVPGQFKSKNRIPGLKELSVGLYDLELQFVAEGRTIGSYKWRLEVVN